MSLKITNANGFIIGGVLNPSITEIYIRSDVNMGFGKQILNRNEQQEIVSVSISTEASVTVLGGIEEKRINIESISPIYWLNYSATVSDMNVLYHEIDTDLKNKLLEINPTWEIEIVHLGVY